MGWYIGESARVRPPGVICGLSLLLVLVLLRGVFSWSPFSLLHKNQHSTDSNSTRIEASSVNIVIYLLYNSSCL